MGFNTVVLIHLQANGVMPEQANRGEVMANLLENRKQRGTINLLDTLLYLVAGSAMTIMSLSFLLWLRF